MQNPPGNCSALHLQFDPEIGCFESRLEVRTSRCRHLMRRIGHKKTRISVQGKNESLHPAQSLPLEGDQPAATGSEGRETGFRKLLLKLLETPRRIKEIYPMVLQRQPVRSGNLPRVMKSPRAFLRSKQLSTSGLLQPKPNKTAQLSFIRRAIESCSVTVLGLIYPSTRSTKLTS